MTKRYIKTDKRKSHLVKKKRIENKPEIIIKDIPLSKKYYRVTLIKLKNKKRVGIVWHDEEDFKRGFSRLKRHESTTFTENDIKEVSTKTHRYRSQRFIAEGFIP